MHRQDTAGIFKDIDNKGCRYDLIPPSATRKLADGMGLPEAQRIWLPDAGHYSALTFLPDILVQLRDFFKDETVLPVSAIPEKKNRVAPFHPVCTTL